METSNPEGDRPGNLEHGPSNRADIIASTAGCATGAAAATAALILCCVSIGVLEQRHLPGGSYFVLPAIFAAITCIFQPMGTTRRSGQAIPEAFLSNAKWGTFISSVGLIIGLAIRAL